MRSVSFRSVLVFLAVLLTAAVAAAQNHPVPLIYPLVPSATAPGGPAFTLTVNGTGFVSGAVVNWNEAALTTTFVSGSQVTAAVPAANIATARTAVITVTNPAPGGGTSNSEDFQVTNATVGLAFQDSPVSNVGPYWWAPAVGDFNRDGKMDIVMGFPPVAGTPQNTVQILLGNGDGTFQAPVTVAAAPAGAQVENVTVGDFNGDGKLDLVISYNNSSNGVYQFGTSVILGNGDGTFQAPVTSLVSTPPSPLDREVFGNWVADVNGDGIPDLVQTCGNGICVALGNGDGTFRLQFTYTPPNSCNWGRPLYGCGPLAINSLTLGDFHKNGKLDIVALMDPYYLIMLPGNGDGTFGAVSLIYGLDAQGTFSVVAADFDNDGNLDLAAFYHNANPPQPTSNTTSAALSILSGNGDGTFQAPRNLTGLSGGGLPIMANLVLGDFNGDGHIDLAVSTQVILIGNGNGPFSYSVIGLPNAVTVAGDFNGGGRLDLAGEDPTQNPLHVFLQKAPPGDFKGSLNPTYQNVTPGGSASYTVTVTAIDGFAGTVQFSASGLLAGATASFSPPTVTGSGSATATITTSSSTPNGSYTITLSGTSGALLHAGAVTLNVGPSGTNFADFTGSVQPTYITATPGGTGSQNVQIVPLNGFNSDVSLSVSGLPAGATASFSPSVVTGGSGYSVLSVTTAGTTPTATYQLVITATGGGKTHTNTVGLNVGPSGTDFTDFTGSVTPLSQTVKVGQSTTYTANVQLLYGTGCVSLETFNIPPNSGAHYDRTTPICGASVPTVLTVVTSPQTPVGTYTITIEGYSSGGFTHSQNITLTVTP